jgi:peptidoglycan/LPS O-acetylase OafA/YrhL
MTSAKKYFKNLDAIRFFAALTVYFSHSLTHLIISGKYQSFWVKFLLQLFSNGNIGVTIFFTLSGFLITYLLLNERKENGFIDIKKFYYRRILRIWPLYYLVLIFSFFIYPFFNFLIGINDHSDANLLYHLFFLSNFDLINILQLIGSNALLIQKVSWSISVEEQFYLVWPILFLVFKNKTIFIGVLVIFSLSILYKIFYVNNYANFTYHTFSILVELSIGGLFALLLFYVTKIRWIIEKITTTQTLILVSLTLIIIGLNEEIFFMNYSNLIRVFTICTLTGLIISIQCFSTVNRFNFSIFKLPTKWGKYAYGIYLFHPIILLILNKLFLNFGFETSNILTITIAVLGLPLTVLISSYSYHHFETYFLSLKDKYKS